MSDKAAPARDTKAEQPAPPAAPDNTSRILFDDTQSGKTIGRFTPTEAKACKTNSPEGTVPTLMPGKESNGCEFKGMRDMPKGLSHLDLPNIYNQAAPSTVRFDSTMSNPKDKNPKHAQDGPSGSGAIIGKDTEKGECLVATANHVVSGDKHAKIENIRGITADGKTYPAEVRATDPQRDTAVVALKTGADTEKVCKPFTPVQDINKEAGNGKPIVSLGFASGSKALYASPGKSEGIHSMREDMSPRNIRDLGLAPDARQLRLDNHVKGGQSGGPVVNAEGRLTGLNQSGPEGSTRGSYAVPLDQKRVDDLLARARR